MHSADILHNTLLEKEITVSVAESCTGGLIGYILTERPGSSGFFIGSAVTYSNDSKEKVLGVSHETLLRCGAVSPETAVEMVKGARELFESDYAVSVTGIAGPDGASEDKPVGLVFIAVTDGIRTVATENHFFGDRESIRKATAEEAISMLLEMTQT
ncbi:MAG: CinA family protein [Candidatus Methanogranum gryphiswaldense]|nr:MAG: CinA family protein [Candidatus Methanogranum sp. U3.2.1]